MHLPKNITLLAAFLSTFVIEVASMQLQQTTCYGLKDFRINTHAVGDVQCCYKVQSRNYFKIEVIEDKTTRNQSSYPTFHSLSEWVPGQQRNNALAGKQCEVIIYRTGWKSFRVDNSKCPCVDAISGVNSCCGLFPQGSLVEDENSVPVCGRFFHSPLSGGSGIGHYLSEYSGQIYYSSIFGLLRVRQQPSILRDPDSAVAHFFGLGAQSDAAYFDLDQVTAAIDKGYLRNISISDVKKAAQSGFNSTLDNVVFWTTTVNGGNNFNITSATLLDEIRGENTYPFESSNINIVLHIRRPLPVEIGPKFSHRFLPLQYFLSVLEQLKQVVNENLARVFVVTNGSSNDLTPLLSVFPGSELVLFDDIILGFQYFRHADIIVTSPSSFSHMPAELGAATVVAWPFWHTWSNSKDRVVLTDKSTYNFSKELFVERFCRARECRSCVEI